QSPHSARSMSVSCDQTVSRHGLRVSYPSVSVKYLSDQNTQLFGSPVPALDRCQDATQYVQFMGFGPGPVKQPAQLGHHLAGMRLDDKTGVQQGLFQMRV